MASNEDDDIVNISPSVDSPPQWNYDVFLSFRGADTRTGFTGHLYSALLRDGIHTFLDDKEMETGGEVGSECLRGIEESRFSFVVLSKHYASSTWCLEELVHILKCRRERGHGVWPVFYGVDPSDVEECRGSFAEAFAKHEADFKSEMEKGKRKIDEEEYEWEKFAARMEEWKSALRDVSYLKGLDVRNHADGNEAANIEHLVKEISKRLDRKVLSVARNPVGVRPRAQPVISFLGLDSPGVRVVGIYGMGGVGKTTVAKEVYNSVFNRFHGSCFLSNFREQLMVKGAPYLQRQLLSEILKRKYEKIDNADRGLNIIRDRLGHKQLLLVLDDVDEMSQVNKVLGNLAWLSEGSRVIITTRTKNILQPSESFWQYEVQELDDRDSLQLLCLHAFDRRDPPEDHIDSASRILHYTGGVPLALEVLGSSLRGQTVEVWNSRIEKLKLMANEDIQPVLKISYDSLDDTEKFIFLDIACFFIGYDKDYVMSILEGCGFFPTDGINTLMRRCLVKVDYQNKLWMHDLLRGMGREIVRQESPVDPGERSRLWRHEDVTDVLTSKTGTKVIEGLAVNLPDTKFSSAAKAFKKMKRLRLLKLNHVRLKGSYEYISCKLRWLCWHGFSLESIPSDFDLENLIALDLRHSSLKIFSEEEVTSMKKLKFLDLSHSLELTRTPNFEDIPRIEKLKLKGCISLEQVHDSIRYLIHLRSLNLQGCQKLTTLPGSIGALSSIVNLNMSGCSALEILPMSIGSLDHLALLNLQECRKLKFLPSSIGGLVSLMDLDLSGCSELEELPESIGLCVRLESLNLHNCKSLKRLPGNIGDLKSLNDLNMSGCSKLELLPDSIGSLTHLPILNLRGCISLKYLPQSIGDLKSVKKINLSGCSSLIELPEGIGALEPLLVLMANETALSTLPETTSNLKKLKVLSLRGCDRLFAPKTCPSVLNFLPASLKRLDLRHCNITDDIMPEDLGSLRFLNILKLCGNKFTCLPESINSLPELVELWLNKCKTLRKIPELHSGVNALKANNCLSLETINLRNYHHVGSGLEVQGCPNLREIEGFYSLETVEPETFEALKTCGFFSNGSVPDIQTYKVDSLTDTYTISPLQALAERGIYSLFFPGNEIPTWFTHQTQGETISFRVPSLPEGCKISGIVTCAIYTWERPHESCFFMPYIRLRNRTKQFNWVYTPHITFFMNSIQRETMWLCHWTFDTAAVAIDDIDAGWRFMDDTDEGDEVEFCVEMGFGIRVRQCAVHPQYSSSTSAADVDDENYSHDWASLSKLLNTASSSSSKHRRRFSQSRPRWLTIGSAQKMSGEMFSGGLRGAGYTEWSELRSRRVWEKTAFQSTNGESLESDKDEDETDESGHDSTEEEMEWLEYCERDDESEEEEDDNELYAGSEEEESGYSTSSLD
ncbi:Disease resistance protein RPV1 [Linum perenne]